jgi:hypothetical protein
MAEFHNLRQARKAKTRLEAQNKAAANRARFGVSKQTRELNRADAERQQESLDSHRLENPQDCGH